MTDSILIVGAGRVGIGLAERLRTRNQPVVLLEHDQETADSVRTAACTVEHGDGTDIADLRAAGAENARTIVAATGDDDTNLLIAQLAKSKFGAESIIARVNRPSNVDAFEELGIRAISSDRAIAWSFDNAIERPALSTWTSEIGQGGDVQEIELTVDAFVGKTISQLDEELPDGVLIALINRQEEARMPDPELVLERGDRLTLLGRGEAVEEAHGLIHPA